jgi:hypothetical protein
VVSVDIISLLSAIIVPNNEAAHTKRKTQNICAKATMFETSYSSKKQLFWNLPALLE